MTQKNRLSFAWLIGLTLLVAGLAWAANTKLSRIDLINSTINSTTVGATTPSTGAFTTLTCTGCPPSIAVFSATTLSSDTAVSISTPTTILTRAVTMPSSGCPCRVLLSYVLYITTASSGGGYAGWVNDGSNNMAGTQQGQSNGGSGMTDLSYSGYSTVTYSNGANVTFSLITQSNGQAYTVRAANQAGGSAPNSSFQVAVVYSN